MNYHWHCTHNTSDTHLEVFYTSPHLLSTSNFVAIHELIKYMIKIRSLSPLIDPDNMSLIANESTKQDKIKSKDSTINRRMIIKKRKHRMYSGCNPYKSC